MKLSIPISIKSNLERTKQVFLEGLVKEEIIFSNNISLEHVRDVDYIELHEIAYNRITDIRYKLLLEGEKIDYVTFTSKEEALYNFLANEKKLKQQLIPPVANEIKQEGIFPKQWIWHCGEGFSYSNKVKPTPGNPPEELLYRSPYTSFSNTSEDKLKILSILKQKHSASSRLSSTAIGNKNLIYYSTGGHESWLELLKLSLFSLIEQGNIDYDVLIITTEEFKEKILEFKIQSLVIDFLIVPEPISNIEPSINKLLIYQYKKITDYGKVLFLDCDIIAVRPFTELFLKKINPKKLHTHVNTIFIENHQRGKLPHHFQLTWHGIGVIDNKTIVKLRENNELPFNAGQYLFVPTQEMISHFANIHWLSKEWPEKYFFEQVLMNYYFCTNFMTDISALFDVIQLICITDKPIEQININSIQGQLIHFMGGSTDAESKIKYIKEYANLSKT
jgi:hypothetical protein